MTTGNTHSYYPAKCLPRFPLELVRSDPRTLHICLWDKEAKYKWSIATVEYQKEGPEIRFVGDRPFEERVNWEHFKELCELAQKIAEEVMDAESST